FGKSIAVWGGMLVFIFFISLIWIRQSNDDMTRNAISNISHYYEQISDNDDNDKNLISEAEIYTENQINMANSHHTRNSVIQIVFVLIALGLMMSIYRTIGRRAHRSEIAKIHAEESNKAKSRFLSNMSHDIRSPMNAIVGYTHLMRNVPNMPPKMLEYLDKIDAAGQQLLAIINDVLEMSRIESGKFELQTIPVDLCEVVHAVFDIFRIQMAEKHIAYTIDVSAITDKNVILDKNHFSRVLMNLISNAYKFTPDGGMVAVRVSQSIPSQNGDAEYEFRVKDNGIGMSKEFAKNVFAAFEREKTSTVSGIQGTGLGMSISKSIIDAMGGTITVDTAPGSGTEFRIVVRLPICKEEIQSATKNEPASDENIDFAGKRILLVDDIEVNREIAEMILTDVGFIVETAENGQQAVDMVSHSEPGYYSIVLMDVQMPVMDGYTATKEIRALDNPAFRTLPIVALTANAFKEDENHALEAGMNAHIAKPFDVEKMMTVINEQLAKRNKR
ncbi:MAG: response regulator, partial [Spirochaetales bacterium]|nr:response regulator [Spirochaetales bacterium]